MPFSHLVKASLMTFMMLCTGFFLFAVQPFKLGDRVAVSYTSPAAAKLCHSQRVV